MTRPPAEMPPVNHEEALQLAYLKRRESNLARCYIELATRPTPPAPELMRLHTAVIDALRYVFKDVPDDAEMLRRMEALGAAEAAFAAALLAVK